jgi:ribosomal protein L40E
MSAAGSNGQPHSGDGSPPVAVPPSVPLAAPSSSPSSVPLAAPSSVSPAAPLQQVWSGSLEELRRERLELAERVASLTWDLGGLAYEMAIRDHYRLDVIASRAAELQQADAQLGELERLLASAEGGVHGACRACGAVHSRGASYCWRCGSPLLREARPSVLEATEPIH